MAESLGRDGRVVLAPDLPSPAPRAVLTVAGMAADVAEALDNRGGGPADVVGRSMGGCMALRLTWIRRDMETCPGG
jgi:pimeloyl-ACP methyl ester carboxylesterase